MITSYELDKLICWNDDFTPSRLVSEEELDRETDLQILHELGETVPEFLDYHLARLREQSESRAYLREQ